MVVFVFQVLLVKGCFGGCLFGENIIIGLEDLTDVFYFHVGVEEVLGGVLDAEEVGGFGSGSVAD